jgi:hypothetical protein
MDVGVETDRDAINSECANGLMELDLTLLEVESLGLQLVRDVG